MLASHTSVVHSCLLINIRPTSFLNNYSLKGTNAIVRNPEMSGKFFKHFSKRRKLSKESETIEETFLSDVKPILWGQFGYEPVKIIGYGSYAKVILANSSRHNTKVAIKIVSKIESKSDYVDKFLPREIDIVKKVRHPHLITFLQTIETNARVYLVMELANKGCMLDIIRKAKRLSEPASGVWFKQICDAAEYLHSIGIVHRDLKCENLLLDIKNNIKIIDFGFARSNMLPINGAYKLSETFCGSYAYACPEILTGTPYVGQMADIWSIGIILYVFVIGELPFNTDDKKALVRATQAGPEFEPNACSNSCKRLIEGILLDEDRRMWFPDIRSSRWYTEYCLTPDDNHISKYTLDSEK